MADGRTVADEVRDLHGVMARLAEQVVGVREALAELRGQAESASVRWHDLVRRLGEVEAAAKAAHRRLDQLDRRLTADEARRSGAAGVLLRWAPALVGLAGGVVGLAAALGVGR